MSLLNSTRDTLVRLAHSVHLWFAIRIAFLVEGLVDGIRAVTPYLRRVLLWGYPGFILVYLLVSLCFLLLGAVKAVGLALGALWEAMGEVFETFYSPTTYRAFRASTLAR